METSVSKVGYDKIVEVVNDGLDVSDRINEILVSHDYIKGVTGLYKPISEIIIERKAFFEQIKDLDEQEAAAVYAEVAANRGEDQNVVEVKFIQVLRIVKNSYAIVEHGKVVLADVIGLFKPVPSAS